VARITSDTARERIIQAAEQRLWHYGFKKTTIDEIAQDAGVGKGTVYLHFDSKEDIGLAIIAKYKTSTLQDQEEVARDPHKTPREKLSEILKLPVLRGHERAADAPYAVDMVRNVYLQIPKRLRPYHEQEVALIATVLEEGNRSGQFDVADTLAVAHTLKFTTFSFMPGSICIDLVQNIEEQLDAVINILYKGLRKSPV
jgi:AcrR family transcriptional regulator